MKINPSILLLAVLAITLVAAPALAGIGEISLYGGFASGSYGTGIESEVTTTRVTFNTGDKYQFRVDAGWLRVESLIGVLPGRVGPVPVRKKQGSGGSGVDGMSAGGPGGNSGNGSGSGNQTPDSPDPGSEPTESEDISSSGIGDVYLAVSRRLVGGGARVFRLDGGLEVKAPTADSDEGLGTGEWDARIGVSSEYRFWSATVFGGAGWNYLGDPEWVELANVVDAYGGVESEPLAGRWILSGWLSGNPEVISGVGSRAILGFGLRTTGSWRVRFQATAGLTEGSEDFTVLLAVSHGVMTPTVGTRGPRR